MTYSYEDLRNGEGLDLGASRWVRVDQERIDRFAQVSEDHQWIHVDPDRAARGAFASTIAHGYLTITLLGTLLGELLQVDNDLVMVNYGLDRLRFTAPVLSGSELRAHAELHSVTSSDAGLRLTLNISGEVGGSNRPACTASAIVLVRRAASVQAS